MTTQELLPQPFEWCEIPAGQIALPDDLGAFEIAAFAISKYPITVAQYALFVEDKGYADDSYWTPAGWHWRTQENVTVPMHWNHDKFHQPDYPIMDVSWFEAMAFCRWLGQKGGQPISLPAEQQWQWAAQGDTGWVYPWGNQVDKTRWSVVSKGPSAVTRFPSGASPFGVVDMIGNVEEWCLSEYDTAKNDDLDNMNNRVFRGGSWVFNMQPARVTYRSSGDPSSQNNIVGFRIVCNT
jgi:formylglycine-generating enzyme required for sulfatase activity